MEGIELILMKNKRKKLIAVILFVIAFFTVITVIKNYKIFNDNGYLIIYTKREGREIYAESISSIYNRGEVYTFRPLIIHTEIGDIYLKCFKKFEYYEYPWLRNKDVPFYSIEIEGNNKIKHDLIFLGKKIEHFGLISINSSGDFKIENIKQDFIIEDINHRILNLRYNKAKNIVYLDIYSAPPYYIDMTLEGEVIKLEW
jgi:hypothetical protein